MTVVGMNVTVNSNGEKTTTLHVIEEFEGYYNNPQNGRTCTGKKAGTVYVGTYDCSSIKVGSEVDIYYDKAVSTSKGTLFQSVKKIEVLSK